MAILTLEKKDRRMAGTIIALAWPTMVEQLLQTAVQYIDTAMVGSLGTAATAAVGATTTVNWLVGSSIGALSIGFLSYIARALGAEDEQRARRISAQAVLTVLVVGILATVLTLSLSGRIPAWMSVDESIQADAAAYFFILYTPMLFRTASIIFGTVLRASGDTARPMKIGILVNIINVVLNFLLIYPTRPLFGGAIIMPGAGMGVKGAALASAIAVAVGGIIISIVLFRHPKISPRGCRMLPDRELLVPCFKVAFPNMLQRFGTSLGYVVFASMINSLGGLATAVTTIANTVESAFYIPAFGMQTAASTLAGNALGAEDRERMKRLGKMFIPIEVGLMIISGALLFIFARPLADIFSNDPEAIGLAAKMLKMVALSEPFYGFWIIIEGFMHGVGNTKEPFVYSIIGMWIIRIGGSFLLVNILGFGLVAAWSCMIAHNMALFFIFLYIYLSGRWNPLHKKVQLK